MEKQLNFVLKLSLKELALRKVVVCLWNESDSLVFIEKYICGLFEEYQETFEDQIKIVEVHVKNNVSKLALPISLKEQMMCLVRPIGLDIVRWKRFHELYISYQNFDVHILKQLQWSCIGAIDYQKTAEKLVCLEIFDIVKRYRLACFYCFVDYIPLLWNELDEESQMGFYQFDPEGISDYKLENVWPYILKGEESVLEEITRRNSFRSFNQRLLESLIYNGNKAAIKHFFPLLTAEEKDSFLETAVFNAIHCPQTSLFSCRRIGDALCYLLSTMEPEKQMEVLRKNPCEVLCCLLEWPCYDLFVDLTNILWNFLPNYSCYSFFIRCSAILFQKVKFDLFSCPNLLQKLFLSGPSEFKRDFVIYESQRFIFFNYFFCNQDTESIKVVLRNLNASDRVDLVSHREFFELFNIYIGTDEWYLVELCFREAVQSKEDKERLKKRFMKVFQSTKASESLLFGKRKWEELIELLEVADATSANKRSFEDASVLKAKILH